jgi:hypothetical protein
MKDESKACTSKACLRARAYREAHREAYNEYHRNYRNKNYEKVRQQELEKYQRNAIKYTCECGAQLLTLSRRIHEQTQKHKRGLLFKGFSL